MDAVRQIADAVLYEGYILWPYRRSALKNRQRWTFGGVYPRGHSERHHDDAWQMRTECLLEGGEDVDVEVEVRFLQVVERQVLRRGRQGFEAVDELIVDGERHLSWEEAIERRFAARAHIGRLIEDPLAIDVDVPSAADQEQLRDAAGRVHGAVVRSWHALTGSVVVDAQRRRGDLRRVTVTISNTTPWPAGAGDRAAAVQRAFCSTHTILRAPAGAGFVSLTDPPAQLRDEAQGCRNEGTWPVLVGETGDRSTLLSSPIILEDHPRIAPESPGDLFDGGEIDQLLTLNILSLTDEEKAEMRDSDPRAREILERTERLSEQELMNLHGAIRDFRQVRG